MRLEIEKVLILKSVGMFSNTSDSALVRIAPILEEYGFLPGDIIFNKGDLGESMFVIIEGAVKIHDGDQTITTLHEHDVFGELAVLDPELRSASATAVEATNVFQIHQQAFYEALHADPEIANGIIRTLCRRLRKSLPSLKPAVNN